MIEYIYVKVNSFALRKPKIIIFASVSAIGLGIILGLQEVHLDTYFGPQIAHYQLGKSPIHDLRVCFSHVP